MINAIWGISHTPFQRDNFNLLPQQQEIFDIIKTHTQHGGFSVVIGDPGVGKSILREHIEQLNGPRECTVVSCSRCVAGRIGVTP